MSTQAMKQALEAITYLMAGSYRNENSGRWDRVSMPKDKALDMGAAAIDALRAAIQQAAQPAEVTDDQIESCALEAGFSVESTGSIWAVDGLVGTRVDPGLRKFARAIERSLRPAAVPMTDAGVDAMRSALEWIARVNAMDYEYQRVAKAALSAITAQPKKETP